MSVSHAVSLICTQVTKIGRLNELCDIAGLHTSEFHSIRRSEPTNRSALSHGNVKRSATMAAEFYSTVFPHLVEITPEFGESKKMIGIHGGCRMMIDVTTSLLPFASFRKVSHHDSKAAGDLTAIRNGRSVCLVSPESLTKTNESTWWGLVE